MAAGGAFAVGSDAETDKRCASSWSYIGCCNWGINCFGRRLLIIFYFFIIFKTLNLIRFPILSILSYFYKDKNSYILFNCILSNLILINYQKLGDIKYENVL